MARQPHAATRTDKFTRQTLAETGLLGMVGKSVRAPAAAEAFRKLRTVYLTTVSGAAE